MQRQSLSSVLVAGLVFLALTSNITCSRPDVYKTQLDGISLSVRVEDKLGQPIKNRKVVISGLLRDTNQEGWVEIPTRAAERVVLPVKVDGYADGYAIAGQVAAGKDNRAYVALSPMTGRSEFTAELGGRISIGQLAADIPGGIWTDAEGHRVYGKITVQFAEYNDHDRQSGRRTFPPTPMGGWLGDTYGVFNSAMMGFMQFESDGKIVQPAAGSFVQLDYAIAPEMQRFYRKGDKVPMWRFDGSEAWIYEGEGTVIEDASFTKRVRGLVNHFSWHNFDDVHPSDCVWVKVVDSSGSKIKEPFMVTIDAGGAHNESITNGDSAVCLDFPKDGPPAQIRALPVSMHSTHYKASKNNQVTGRPDKMSISPFDGKPHKWTSCQYQPAECQNYADIAVVEYCPNPDTVACQSGPDAESIVCQLVVSDAFCGDCANHETCAAGKTCRRNLAGTPSCLCPPNLNPTEEDNRDCNGTCFNVKNTTNHCGDCVTSCASLGSHALCDHGTCACDKDTKACSGTCTDVLSDDKNCGDCSGTGLPGVDCTKTGTKCKAGKCLPKWETDVDVKPWQTPILKKDLSMTSLITIAGRDPMTMMIGGSGGHLQGGLLRHWEPVDKKFVDNSWETIDIGGSSSDVLNAWAPRSGTTKITKAMGGTVDDVGFFLSSGAPFLSLQSIDGKNITYSTGPLALSTINATGGTSYTDVYAVGANVSAKGGVLHCTTIPSCFDSTASWMTEKLAVRTDKSADVDPSPLRAIASEGNLVVAVGEKNTIVYKIDTGSWTTVEFKDIKDAQGNRLLPGQLNGVFLYPAGGDIEIIIVGDSGVLLTGIFSKGTMGQFSQAINPPPSSALSAVWGLPAKKLFFAVGTGGKVLFSSNGKLWVDDSVPGNIMSLALKGVWGADGASWTDIKTGAALSGVEVWAVGSNGQIIRRRVQF